ncbi:hypothetical protein U1Q18_041577 [Sarracenia purpurea var. burkii]
MKVSFSSSLSLNAEIMCRLALDQNLFAVFYGATQESGEVLVAYGREEFDLVPDLIDAAGFRRRLCRKRRFQDGVCRLRRNLLCLIPAITKAGRGGGRWR